MPTGSSGRSAIAQIPDPHPWSSRQFDFPSLQRVPCLANVPQVYF